VFGWGGHFFVYRSVVCEEVIWIFALPNSLHTLEKLLSRRSLIGRQVRPTKHFCHSGLQRCEIR
jgi:hypothetical protein